MVLDSALTAPCSFHHVEVEGLLCPSVGTQLFKNLAQRAKHLLFITSEPRNLSKVCFALLRISFSSQSSVWHPVSFEPSRNWFFQSQKFITFIRGAPHRHTGPQTDLSNTFFFYPLSLNSSERLTSLSLTARASSLLSVAAPSVCVRSLLVVIWPQGFQEINYGTERIQTCNLPLVRPCQAINHS